jgi:hypothetical protein
VFPKRPALSLFSAFIAACLPLISATAQDKANAGAKALEKKFRKAEKAVNRAASKRVEGWIKRRTRVMSLEEKPVAQTWAKLLEHIAPKSFSEAGGVDLLVAAHSARRWKRKPASSFKILYVVVHRDAVSVVYRVGKGQKSWGGPKFRAKFSGPPCLVLTRWKRKFGAAWRLPLATHPLRRYGQWGAHVGPAPAEGLLPAECFPSGQKGTGPPGVTAVTLLARLERIYSETVHPQLVAGASSRTTAEAWKVAASKFNAEKVHLSDRGIVLDIRERRMQVHCGLLDVSLPLRRKGHNQSFGLFRVDDSWIGQEIRFTGLVTLVGKFLPSPLRSLRSLYSLSEPQATLARGELGDRVWATPLKGRRLPE